MPMLVELYVSNLFHLKKKENLHLCLFENELGYEHGLFAIRLVVAKTQEIISRVFSP